MIEGIKGHSAPRPLGTRGGNLGLAVGWLVLGVYVLVIMVFSLALGGLTLLLAKRKDTVPFRFAGDTA